MVFLVKCVTHLAALARGQMTSLLTCSLQWLIKVFVNEALWQRAWTSLWAKAACAALTVSLARKRGWTSC